MAASMNLVDDETLIHAIERYPIIYDTQRNEYRNTSKRQLVFQSIAEELHSTAAICENRWRVLRAKFSREKKAQLPGRSGSGSKGNGKQKEWALYNFMRFIEPHVVARRRPGSLDLVTDDTSCSSESVLIGSQPGTSGITASSHSISLASSQHTELQEHDEQTLPDDTIDLQGVMDVNPVSLTSPSFPRNVMAKKTGKGKRQMNVSEEILNHLKRYDEADGTIDCAEMWLLSLKKDFTRLGDNDQLLFKIKVEQLLFNMLTAPRID